MVKVTPLNGAYLNKHMLRYNIHKENPNLLKIVVTMMPMEMLVSVDNPKVVSRAFKKVFRTITARGKSRARRGFDILFTKIGAEWNENLIQKMLS